MKQLRAMEKIVNNFRLKGKGLEFNQNARAERLSDWGSDHRLYMETWIQSQ